MRHPDPQTAAAIAEATHVPTGYLSKILQELVRHGVAHSQRGLGGGFQLTRDPEGISVLEVLVAAGSPIHRINKCPLGLPAHTKLCPVHKLMDDGLRLIEHTFETTTLAELCRGGGENPGLCHDSSKVPGSSGGVESARLATDQPPKPKKRRRAK